MQGASCLGNLAALLGKDHTVDPDIHPIEAVLRTSRFSYLTSRITAWAVGLIAVPFLIVGSILSMATLGIINILLLPLVLLAYGLTTVLGVMSILWWALPITRPLLILPGILLAVLGAVLVSLAMPPGEPRAGKTGQSDMIGIIASWPATKQAFEFWQKHGYV